MFLIIIPVILLIGLDVLYLSGKWYLLRGIKVIYLKGHTSTYIDDWPQFDNATISNDPDSAKSQKWELANNYNKHPQTERLKNTHKRLGSIAFLIIKNNKIWHEYYVKGYGVASKTNSFSMAKSITIALLGKAIEEGYIKNLEQPVRDFFPEFDNRVTIGDLASMASGMTWNEDYNNPLSSVAQLYLEKDLRAFMLKQKIVEAPGKRFDYNSGNTQLLGMVIEKATKQKMADYLSEKFWKPMGMQENALWELDSVKNKMAKAYCCIASNARDFARFGRLFAQKGQWNGKQLLDADFIEKCLKPRFDESLQYGYGFWLSNYKNKSIFTMRGILGQYVISIPEDELIIVRLGKKRYEPKNQNSFPKDFYIYIDEAYKMLKN